MLYEGSIEIIDDMVNVDLVPPNEEDSQYRMQFLNEPATLVKALKALKPQSPVEDEPDQTPQAMANNLAQNRFANFRADSMNIRDLMNLYSRTPPKDMNPFPGLASPKKSGEIVFIETIRNFKSIVDGRLIEMSNVEFTYRRVLV